jgi:hypothetical protein
VIRSTGGNMTSELNLDWLISVDDHVLEPSPRLAGV